MFDASIYLRAARQTRDLDDFHVTPRLVLWQLRMHQLLTGTAWHR